MDVEGVVERAQRIAAVRADVDADRVTLVAAIEAERELRAWLDSSSADLAGRLREVDPFVTSTLAEASRRSTSSANATLDRATTLAAVPELASALDDGRITAGHVDAVTQAGKRLDDQQRRELHARIGALVDRVGDDSVTAFRRLADEVVTSIRRNDGEGVAEGQRRDVRASSWVDRKGMWNLRARFDPVTGLRLDARLRNTLEALFAESAPDSCPSDPLEKQQHLRALALARLLEGDAPPARAGRPEFVAVIDLTPEDGDQPTADEGDRRRLVIDWPLPVEIPDRVVRDLIEHGDADTSVVVVCNGVVLSAPGRLDLGRTTRLANRAQRRALRGMYATCAIPGCDLHYDRCELHHVIWWRHGGRTDLENLLPVCVRHHTRIHDDDWQVKLGPNRELTITLPDGTTRSTGPPSRRGP